MFMIAVNDIITSNLNLVVTDRIISLVSLVDNISRVLSESKTLSSSKCFRKLAIFKDHMMADFPT